MDSVKILQVEFETHSATVLKNGSKAGSFSIVVASKQSGTTTSQMWKDLPLEVASTMWPFVTAVMRSLEDLGCANTQLSCTGPFRVEIEIRESTGNQSNVPSDDELRGRILPELLTLPETFSLPRIRRVHSLFKQEH